MKKNIEWYEHRKDSHRHPKFKLLRTLYGGGDLGWAMEAKFWALNNMIADSEDCTLDISKTRNKAVVAEELGLSLAELEQFIARLVHKDLELLIEVEPGKYYTEKVKEILEKLLAEREKARAKKGKGKNSEVKPESSPELLESSEELYKRVEESRVKESTVHNSKVKEDDNQEEHADDLPLTPLPDLNLPLLTSYEDYVPESFTDANHVRRKIAEMFAAYCNTELEKAEVSRFFNIIMNTPRVNAKTAFRFAFNCVSAYARLPDHQRNLPYLSKQIEGKIRDAKENRLKELDKQKTIPGGNLAIESVIQNFQMK